MGRVIPADLRINGCGGEQGVQIIIIQKSQILFKIALHAADARHITRIPVSLYIQLAKLGHNHIAHKEGFTLHVCSADKIDQKLALNHKNIHGSILYAFRLRIDAHFADTSLFNVKGVIENLVAGLIIKQLLRQFLLVVSDREICAAVHMRLQHRIEIKINHHIGVCHDHIFFFLGS